MNKILLDKKFWAAIVTLIVVIGGQALPGFNLDEGGLVAALVLAAGYIIGVTVDEHAAPGWRGVVQSRKFWASVVGGLFILLRGFGVQVAAEVTPDLLIMVCTVLGGYAAAAGAERKPPAA